MNFFPVFVRQLSDILSSISAVLVNLDMIICIIWIIAFFVNRKPAKHNIDSQPDDMPNRWSHAIPVWCRTIIGVVIHTIDMLAFSILMTLCEDGWFSLSFSASYGTPIWILSRLGLLSFLLRKAEATLVTSGSERVNQWAKRYVMTSFLLAPVMFCFAIVLFFIMVVCSYLWYGLCSFASVRNEALPFQWIWQHMKRLRLGSENKASR